MYNEKWKIKHELLTQSIKCAAGVAVRVTACVIILS
jgi:hypothetical protein